MLQCNLLHAGMHTVSVAAQAAVRQAAAANGWICAICWEPIINSSLHTLDHIVPKARGLPGVNSIENCQVAHLSCNQRKGNKGPDYKLPA